jgi:predicted metal-dependent hydrolase
VLRQQRYFEKFLPTHPGARYVSGETHLYLGRQYRLRIHQRAKAEVKLLAGRLHIWTPDCTNSASIRMLLDEWYRDHANQIFARRLAICLEQCPALRRRRLPHLLLRRMSHRWGSCTKSGSVLLNLELIKTPTHCIDYVIVHELCHLHVHNHSPAFYRLLGRCLPDWERRKARLEQCRLM